MTSSSSVGSDVLASVRNTSSGVPLPHSSLPSDISQSSLQGPVQPKSFPHQYLGQFIAHLIIIRLRNIPGLSIQFYRMLPSVFLAGFLPYVEQKTLSLSSNTRIESMLQAEVEFCKSTIPVTHIMKQLARF